MEKYSFQWISVDDDDINPEENSTCLVCMDCPMEDDWHLQVARWYESGSKIELFDKYNKSHKFTIKNDGFYILDETSVIPGIFLVHGVKYWAVIPTPKIKPEDTLTIE